MKKYRTAFAKISCAEFRAGDCVIVKYSHTASNGVKWYEVTASQYGPLRRTIMYSEHHLERLKC